MRLRNKTRRGRNTYDSGNPRSCISTDSGDPYEARNCHTHDNDGSDPAYTWRISTCKSAYLRSFSSPVPFEAQLAAAQVPPQSTSTPLCPERFLEILNIIEPNHVPGGVIIAKNKQTISIKTNTLKKHVSTIPSWNSAWSRASWITSTCNKRKRCACKICIRGSYSIHMCKSHILSR